MSVRSPIVLPSDCRTAACSRNSRSLHTAAGFGDFFSRIEGHAKRHPYPIAVAMEGYNGHVRPLDSLVRARGWPLFNVNNLKLARFKEIFPAAAKSDRIDSRQDPGAVPAPRSPADGWRRASGSHGNARGERHPQAPVAPPAPLGERTGARGQFHAGRSSGRRTRSFADHPGCRQPLVLELCDLPRRLSQARTGAPREPAQATCHRPQPMPIVSRFGRTVPASATMPAWSAI